jgi:hypothetical protein
MKCIARIFFTLRIALRRPGAVAALALTLGTSVACIDLKSSPLDTSQGGLFGFLGLLLRDGGARFVAAAESGSAYVSNNGAEWTRVTIVSDTSKRMMAGVWTGARWVVVGGDATTCQIYTSSDAQNWTPAAGVTCSGLLRSVAVNADGSRVVAVGNLSGGSAVILASQDGGLNWSPLTSPSTLSLGGVVFANSQFMAFQDPAGAGALAAYTSNGTGPFIGIASAPQGGAKQNSFGAAFALGLRVIHAADDPCCTAPTAQRSVTTLDNGASAWTVNSANIFGGNLLNLFPRAMAFNAAAPRLVAVGDGCLVDFTGDPASLAWTGTQNVMSGCAGVNWKGLVFDGAKFVAAGTNGSSQAQFALSATGNPSDWVVGAGASPGVNHLAGR